MTEIYRPHGVCSTCFRFEIEDNLIRHVEFSSGCDGNLKAIAALLQGMHIDDAISRLQGIDCGGKGTSCPDQFSKALVEYKKKHLG